MFVGVLLGRKNNNYGEVLKQAEECTISLTPAEARLAEAKN